MDMPEGFRSDWHKLNAREYPYNAAISNENGETRIASVAEAGDGAKIHYALRVVAEGTQPQEAMRQKLDLLQHSFKQLER
jgi:hypothetical protein